MNNIILKMIQINIITLQKKKGKINHIIIKNIQIYIHMKITNTLINQTIFKKMKKKYQLIMQQHKAIQAHMKNQIIIILNIIQMIIIILQMTKMKILIQMILKK